MCKLARAEGSAASDALKKFVLNKNSQPPRNTVILLLIEG